MADRRIPLEKRKYLLFDSQRSGFTYFKKGLVKDNGWWVHPDERDDSPPYPKYIGGEGESNRGSPRSGRKDYPTAKSGDYSP